MTVGLSGAIFRTPFEGDLLDQNSAPSTKRDARIHNRLFIDETVGKKFSFFIKNNLGKGSPDISFQDLHL